MFFVPCFLAALCLTASAGLIPRQEPCSFAMNAVGSPSGSVVEDVIGENRIGGIYPRGYYYIANDALYDTMGHNCIISPQTKQFRCVAGAGGEPTEFSFADDGNLLHNGTASWLACPAAGPGDDGSYNIFTDATSDTTGCKAITLSTGGFNCTALGRSSSSSSALTSLPTLAEPSTFSATSSAGISATATATCPTGISAGVFQFPHLIVPTSPNAPDHAFGDQYSATISPINTTLFNFDIPSSAPYNNTCALLFLFPFGAATYFSGIEEEEGENGGLDFALLAEVANAGTTYDTTGDVAKDYGKIEVLPGSNYTVATFNCQAGATVTYSVSSRGDVELDYFQQSGSNPMGLYIVPCDSPSA